jgi:tripartite-type tricarboxylate transporter receptor subunit TctC
MNLTHFVKKILLVAGIASIAFFGLVRLSWAQNYPNRPITLMVPFAAGGPTDVLARTIAASMTKTLGQTVVVENRLGAGGTVATAAVAKAAPDGYTLLIHHNGMATSTVLYRKLPFNVLTDFSYIGLLADVPMTLLAKKDLPPNNMGEFIAYAKAQGDKINLANAGLGAVSQLCGTLLQQSIGVGFTTIPYQGTAPAMTALLGGQVDVLCDQTTQTLPQIKADKVKLYGVTTAERISSLPDTPTLREGGLKDFEVVVWHGIYAPKGIPTEAATKINAALRAAMKDPMVVTKIAELGAVIVPESKQTSEALQAWLKSEVDKWGPLLRAAGQYAD